MGKVAALGLVCEILTKPVRRVQEQLLKEFVFVMRHRSGTVLQVFAYCLDRSLPFGEKLFCC